MDKQIERDVAFVRKHSKPLECQVCSNPIDSHVEGRSCDRCVAEKLGWPVAGEENNYKDIYYVDKEGSCRPVLYYSSPDMTPETWGLVDKMTNNPQHSFTLGLNGVNEWNIIHNYLIAITELTAPTAPLAICRAFLAQKEGE